MTQDLFQSANLLLNTPMLFRAGVVAGEGSPKQTQDRKELLIMPDLLGSTSNQYTQSGLRAPQVRSRTRPHINAHWQPKALLCSSALLSHSCTCTNA